ncbi:hypothetical protein NQZ68_035814 [Dissostichus eleginoides]|nr:hypothetical protein NQZ68_035814 [Dissostichus eleginoides]
MLAWLNNSAKRQRLSPDKDSLSPSLLQDGTAPDTLPAAGELGVTMETSVPATSSIRPAEQVLVLDPMLEPGGVSGAIGTLTVPSGKDWARFRSALLTPPHAEPIIGHTPPPRPPLTHTRLHASLRAITVQNIRALDPGTDQNIQAFRDHPVLIDQLIRFTVTV